MSKGNAASVSGKVKFFNGAKGYGFIKSSDGSEVFFHAKDCADNAKNLKDDDSVTFHTEEGKKGLAAKNVTLVK